MTEALADRIRRYMNGHGDIQPGERCSWCKGELDEPPAKGCRVPFKYWHRCGKAHVGTALRCDLRIGFCLLEEAGEKAKRLQVRADAIPIDAPLVHRAIRKLHDPRRGWELFPEFQLYRRRIDSLAVRLYNSGPPLVGYEIKVDRGDFESELRNPDKRVEAMDLCSAFYFASPKGLIAPGEIPEGCGLIEVSMSPRGGAYPSVAVAAPERPVTAIPTLFVARMLWRLRGAS